MPATMPDPPPAAPQAAPDPGAARPEPKPEAAGESLVEAELLVEEISIDGMCGVY